MHEQRDTLRVPDPIHERRERLVEEPSGEMHHARRVADDRGGHSERVRNFERCSPV
jgi:hypothetical protein